MRELELNRVYRHFKGKYVYVRGLALDSETLEQCVIYNHLGEDKIWVRKLDIFLEEIDENRIDNINHQKYRFELIGEHYENN
jgi:hypothetical protein